jgi:V-type H+-transporting ATPase subunit a
MEYVSVIMSQDAAHSCIRELGQMGCIQFTDLNPELTPFQRRYVAYVKRCDEIERKIRYVHGEVVKVGVPVQSAGSIEHFVENALAGETGSASSLLESLESKLDQYEHQLLDLNKYNNRLTEEYNGKVEFHHVLVKARSDFMTESNNLDHHETASSHSDPDRPNSSLAMVEAPLMPGQNAYQADEMSFSNIAGVLPVADRARFERMLFRSTRGNCYVRFADIEEPIRDAATGTDIHKVVFVVFFKSAAIEAKVKRICDAFSAHRYDLKNLDRPREIDAQQDANYRELEDAKKILDKNTETRIRLCVELAQHVEEWLWVVRREKATYHTLNLFRSDVGNFLRGQGWILKDSVGKARAALDRAQATLNLPSTSMIERVMEIWAPPPTHFRTNKFTDAYQEFVNTYGIPRYREINPALFTAATFPFLFAVMYGDIGHGSCLLIGGLYLVLTEKKAEDRSMDEMMKGMYSARYMLFMMGLYSVYCGLVYNDFFSLGLNLFYSNFDFINREAGDEAERHGDYGDSSKVYPFGVDPAWHISENELLFFNSMKMKMSVILGIIQMTLGICLKGINAIYFHSYLDFFCEFIPMILFDVGFFGYMLILIFIKWSINWDARMQSGSCNYDVNGVAAACQLSEDQLTCYTVDGKECDAATEVVDMCPLDYGGTGDGCQPPNLITTLINIALVPGSVDEPMYEGQAGVQTFLLLMAFMCVPWLLCVKPLYLKYTHKPAQGGQNSASNPLLDAEGGGSDASEHGHGGGDHGHGGGDHGHGGEFDFGEIFIHQAIETIEFVLGMVSNTASYLRLWALSLAHSELATVFWGKAMLSMINTNNPVMVYFGYATFAAVSFAVLLCMDLLECFLHALRLHWVEFQNKFFKADGYRFQPFDFRGVLERAVLDA